MAGLHAAPLLALMLLGAEPSPAPVTAAGFADAVLKPHRGRTVVVNFWSAFCQPCLHEIPVLQKLDAKLWRDDVDLVFVATDPVDLSRRVSQTFALKAHSVLRPGTIGLVFAIGACAPTPIAKSAPSCPTPSHDDGLGSCVALDACAPSFTLDSSGRCARWIELPPLPTAVAGATATLLGDGRVLVAGGSVVDAAGEAEPTNLAAVIAPAGDSFVPGAMIEARDRHAAALLANGTVLVVGGFNRTAFPDAVEVYVPEHHEFAPAGFDSDILPSAAVDDRGRIWIVGGHTKVFDPATLDLTDEVDPPEQHSTGHLVSIPGAHSALLFGGGVTFSDGSELLQTQVDILDTSAGTWSLLADGGPALLRTDAAVGVLGDGRVVVAGGLVDGKANAAAFFLDAAARTIDPAPPLPVGIGLACAASSGGSVVVAGGLVDGTGVTDRSFVYEPDGTLTSLPPLPSARARAACVTLADGRVLVAGGENADGSVADVAILERGLR